MDISHIHSGLPDHSEIRRRLTPAAEIRQGTSAEEKRAIQEAAEAFESYFLQIMLREMRKTVPENDLIPKSQAEQIFTEMLDEEMSVEMARAGGIGLSQKIIQQLTRDSYMSNVR